MSMSFEDFENWQQATRFKACFLLSCLLTVDEDLCWIDADARIRKIPRILMDPKLSETYDLACVFFRDKELLSGTLWLARNPTTFKLVRRWMDLNQDPANAKFIEQRNLQVALLDFPEARILRLPPEYAFIFDLSRKYTAGIEPVIEHFQMSRVIRKLENEQRRLGRLSKPQS
jgi:hypothetical protein